MGQDIGYIRVSSIDQNTARQLDGIQLEKTFTDKASGKNTDRPQLQKCLGYIREGDTLHVHSMDRLARNLMDLQGMVEDLNGKGISVKFHKENLNFTGENDHLQKLMLQIMGAVAEFERANIKERQLEGIKKAQEQGKHMGRRPTLSEKEIEEIILKLDNGKSQGEVAGEYGVARQTIYRALKQRGFDTKTVRKPPEEMKVQELKEAADTIGFIIAQHDGGTQDQAIAEELNRREWKQPNGEPWSAMMVERAVRRQGMF